MTRQYLRKVIATFTGKGGELKVEDLRMEFLVTKNISASQNKAAIKIYNLKQGNRTKIKEEFDAVKIEAGYQGTIGAKGNVGIIFSGQIRTVLHHRNETDIITTVECGDGDKAARTGAISKSFPKGTKPKEMLEELITKMPGVEKGEWKGVDDLPAYTRPVVMCGACSKELNKIARTHKLHWSIQDGALEIVPGDGYIDDNVVISPESGMLSVPSITDNGIRVKTLLNPQLRINRTITVKSEELEMNGAPSKYRISGLSFKGNNMDGDFEAEILGESIDGKKVDEGKTGAEVSEEDVKAKQDTKYKKFIRNRVNSNDQQ